MKSRKRRLKIDLVSLKEVFRQCMIVLLCQMALNDGVYIELVKSQPFLTVLHKICQIRSIGDGHINDHISWLIPYTYLLFFIHISSIFQANLVVLQVYGREMAIRASSGQFGAKLSEAEINEQQVGTIAPVICQGNNVSMPWCQEAEATTLLIRILAEKCLFDHSEALDRVFYKKRLFYHSKDGKMERKTQREASNTKQSRIGEERTLKKPLWIANQQQVEHFWTKEEHTPTLL